MPRFTISRHTDARDGDHYDLLLERGDVLRTWRILHTSFGTAQPARQIPDHRLLYLDFEGPIPGERGSLQIFDTGVYEVDVWNDALIQVALAGQRVRTRLRFTPGPRHPEAPDPAWIVVDPCGELRKAAASLLRESALDAPPSPELAEMRDALAAEDRKVMRFVDLYVHGSPVDGRTLSLDEALLRRVESEAARWKHPWLAAARVHASRLADLVKELRRARLAV
jgi:hypothetical protein